jgi:splicing factor 3A subunit 2
MELFIATVLRAAQTNDDLCLTSRSKDRLTPLKRFCKIVTALQADKMDYQNRAGSRFGRGAIASKEESAMDRRERLRCLALETIDISKDPYGGKNHMGSYECKLCLTVHVNDGSYLAHTQGKKHQTNLARRAAIEFKSGVSRDPSTLLPSTGLYLKNVPVKKNFMKIGRPGYRVTKMRDPVTQQRGLIFQLQFPRITRGVKPRFRFMSTWESIVEPADKRFQYLICAAEPYESVAFKIESRQIDRREGKLWTHWDTDIKQYSVQFLYMTELEEQYAGVPVFASRQ